MLERFNSFYPSTLASMVHKGWQKIPTDKVSDFFQKNVPTYVRSAWERFPSYKIPSPKKIALFTAGFFVAYKMYRLYQSLNTRLTKLEKDNKALIDRTKALEDAKSILEKKIAALEEDVEGLEDLKMQSFSEESIEDNDSQEQLQLNPAQELVVFDERTALNNMVEKFKATIPGRHIVLNDDPNPPTFADFLLKTFFRIDEITSVEFEQESQTFTLSYNSPKIVTVTKLPQIVWDRMSFIIRGIVNPLLKISPAAQISNSITVKFTKTDQGTEMVFDEEAFSLMKNRLSYTAHIKSIIIPQDPQEDLIVHSEHNSSVGKKVGHVEALLFVEILELNFQQGRQLIE